MTGLIGGTATGLTEGLKTHMKRQGDAFDSGLKAALENTERRRIKHDKDREEAETALEVMSSLTGGDLSKAELLIKKTGGVSMTQDFVTNFLKASRVDPNITIDKVAPFLAQHEGSLTSEQALNAMVGKFSATLPAEQEKTLFGDPRNMRKQLSERYKAMGIPVADAGSVQAKRAATPGAINQSLLRTPEEKFAARTAKAGIEQLEQTLKLGAENLKVLQNTVAQLPRVNQEAIEEFQLAQDDKRSSMEDRSRRLRIFEQEHTPEMIKLNRRLTIAKTIKAESGTDAEMQWNLLDTQERHYRQQIRDAATDAGGMPTGRQVQIWRDQIKDIGTSKGALVKTMAADASTIYSKDSPKGIFKDKLQATINSIEGLKYADSLAGMIQNMTAGQAPMVLAAYQQHAKEMRHIYANNPHRGIQDQIKIANSNAKLAENMIFKRAWDNKKAAKTDPKPLYVVVDGKVQLDNQGYAKYNPNVKTGDRVIINDPYMLGIRKKQGYHSNEAIKYPRSYLGFRAAGSKTSPFPESNR